MKLSDAEILAEFMEPKPELPPYWSSGWPDRPWWVLCKTNGGGMGWFPRCLTLDACHEIEARLTDEQWGAYGLSLAEKMLAPERHFARKLIHADAPMKITTLAAVLRPIVEAR